jgi:putative peptidoglycan lipid II flippase
MIRHILTVSTGTLTSRLLGFTRDALIAALLGAGPIADAFLVAFQFINVTRRLLTEGALNAALVPGYLHVRGTEGSIAAAAFAGRVLGSVSLVLIAIAFVLGLLMPTVIAVLAPGFTGSPTLQLAIDNARMMLPYFAFVGPVTVMMGVLNAEHRFVLTAFSPVLFNLTMIATLIVLIVWRHDAIFSATVIAAMVGIAGNADPDTAQTLARWPRDAGEDFIRPANPQLFPQGDPRHDCQRRTTTADRWRRYHCLHFTRCSVVALFRQPLD